MNLKPIIGLVVLGGILTAGYFIDRSRAATENLLSGTFENEPTLASSRAGGRVMNIFVKEGQTVKAGQPLVRLENEALAESVRSQFAAASAAQEEFRETENGPRPEDIAKQKAAVQEAQADYQKLVNGPLPEEIRSARDKLAQANAAYQKALSGPRKQEIDAARAADLVAEAKLREAENGPRPEDKTELAARLSEAIADEALTSKKLERAEALGRQGAIPQEEVDEATSAEQEAQGRLRDARAALQEAQRGTRHEEIAQARETYRQAHAQLDLELAGSRPEDIESAREDMRMADESLKLLLRGSRQEDIDAARSRLVQAQQALVELQRGSRPEDIAKAKESRRQAALAAKSARTNLSESIVYAPISGQIDRVLAADGDLMTPNSPVVQLSNPTDIWIRVYVPEERLAKVRVGDPANVLVDGISGTLPAHVDSIDAAGQFTPANLQDPEERGRQVFGVRIRLAHPDPRVKAGMYATVAKVGH